MAPWLAAQAVQRSAFSDGSNYRAHWAAAARLLGAVLHNGNTAGSCGQGVPRGVTGPDHGLPAGYTIPAGTGPAHARRLVMSAVEVRSCVCLGGRRAGRLRLFGADHGRLGDRRVPRSTTPAASRTRAWRLPRPSLQPGDLVLVPGSDSPGPGLAGHVGIYLGYGLVLSRHRPGRGRGADLPSVRVRRSRRPPQPRPYGIEAGNGQVAPSRSRGRESTRT